MVNAVALASPDNFLVTLSDRALISLVKATVPVALGKVITLSAVGSVTVSFVSCASAVAPSNSIVLFSTTCTVSLLMFEYLLQLNYQLLLLLC